MTRRKKKRSLKGKVNVKTGSKQDFIGQGEKGRIPSHNRLAKHKKRQKSAYEKHLEATGQRDDSGRPKPSVSAEPVPEPVQTSEPEESGKKSFDELSADELLHEFEKGQ